MPTSVYKRKGAERQNDWFVIDLGFGTQTISRANAEKLNKQLTSKIKL